MKGWQRFSKSATTVLVSGFLGALIGTATGYSVNITLLAGIATAVMVSLLIRYCLSQEDDWQKKPSGYHEDGAVQTYAYRTFLATTFQVMGYLTQIKGCAEVDELQSAKVIIGYMRLTPVQQQQAILLFKQGKHPNFAIDPVLAQFYHACQHRAHFIRQFIEIQISVFYAHGLPSPRERAMLLHICNQLGFARRFEEMETYIRRRFHTASTGTNTSQDNQKRHPTSTTMVHLHRAYGILGLNRYATNAEVKKAYRRLINRHHPDKLEAQNTSTETMQEATEKTRIVKEAYDLIKLYRRL